MTDSTIDGTDGTDAAADGTDASGSTDRGFPEGKPWTEMAPAEQVAYWRDKAQKHETRSRERADYDQVKAERDRLKTATQTDADKAIATAAEAARREGEATATARFSDLLVASKFEAALAGRRKPDEISVIVSGIDPKKFLTDSGEVDTDKVTQYAAGLAPAGSSNGWPDTGQGNRGTGTSGKGVAVGAEMFAAKRGKTTT